MNERSDELNGFILAIAGVIVLVWLSPFMKPKAPISGEPGYREPRIETVEVLK